MEMPGGYHDIYQPVLMVPVAKRKRKRAKRITKQFSQVDLTVGNLVNNDNGKYEIHDGTIVRTD